MSKLDDILFFQSQPMSGNMLSDWQIEQAKQQIKDLFNDLIGEDATIADMEELWARGDEMDITSELHSEGMNMFKVELRKKLEDL
jgi:hypothetical protein